MDDGVCPRLRSRVARLVAVVAVAGVAVGCDAADKDDGSDYAVRVVDLGDFPFCSASDPFRIDDLSWLFQAKYRMEFEPGLYPVEEGGRIPYRIEVRGQVREVVPSPGTATLVVDEDPFEAEYEHESDLLQQGAFRRLLFNESFTLDPPLMAEPWWQGNPLDPLVGGIMYGVSADALELSGGEFIIDGEANMFLSGSIGPWTQCSRPNDPVERIDVQLEGGEVSFEVRHVPRDAGLMTSAQGTIEGHDIAVTAYDRLAYSASPIYAVQFEEPWADGECALYIQQLASDAEPLPPEAWLLDCESNKLREIAVLDFEVTTPEP